MATSTKKSRKSAPKTGAAKRTTKKATAKRAAKPAARPASKTASQPNPTRRTRRPELADAAKYATTLVTVAGDGSGKTINRAPIGTTQMGLVKDYCGRKRPADVLVAMIGGPKKDRDAKLTDTKIGKLAADYAGGKIGQTDLPDGARGRISAAAAAIGDPKKHKVNGRAFVAAVVALHVSRKAGS